MKSLSRARKVEDLAIPTLLGIASARQKLSDFFNRMSEESPTAHEHFGKPCIIGAARQAYLAFECFVLALVEKHVREPPQGTWSGMNYLHSRLAPNYLAVPDSYSIPFSDFMDLPLPFTEDATENFATCHLRQMTEPSFLEDGEWAGYYSVDIGEESTTTFDPPMHNIRFIVGEPNEESLPIVGTGGRDGVGSFTLDGVMDSNTGALMIKKDYDNYGPHWIWTGFLTPFGIIASWGTATWGGWVWLYKEEWCPRDTP